MFRTWNGFGTFRAGFNAVIILVVIFHHCPSIVLLKDSCSGSVIINRIEQYYRLPTFHEENL